eukprot:270626-Chlamydomonas_euryale.AAC.1
MQHATCVPTLRLLVPIIAGLTLAVNVECSLPCPVQSSQRETVEKRILILCTPQSSHDCRVQAAAF